MLKSSATNLAVNGLNLSLDSYYISVVHNSVILYPNFVKKLEIKVNRKKYIHI